MANGRHIENRSCPIFFCFLTAFWASTSGGFRIVSVFYGVALWTRILAGTTVVSEHVVHLQ